MKNVFIHPTAIIDEGVSIGKGSHIWCFCHLQSHCSIGEGCSLGQNVNIADHVKIGNFVKIQNNVSIYSGVELQDGVFCGPSCVFTNDPTPRSEYPKDKAGYQKTLVCRGASIGANATILCGNTIGQYAMVAAGAVVTRPVLDYALVAGSPARRIGWVCRCGVRLNDALYCDICGISYQKCIVKLS